MILAYVINLDRRPERWERMKLAWSKHFDLIRFPAIEIPGDGARGCKLSHVAVAEKYLAKHEMIPVLEDDAQPTPNFDDIGMKCIEQAYTHLDKWDIINFGPYLDLTPIGMRRATLHPTTSHLFFHATYAHQTHFMIYNYRSSRELLGKSLTSHIPLDMWLGQNATAMWVPIKLLATQADGPSDVQNKEFDKKLLYGLTEKMLNENLSTKP